MIKTSSNFYDISIQDINLWRVPHELLPQKRLLPTKFQLGFIISKLINPACNCIINCYLYYMIGIELYWSFQCSQKVFLFCSKLARNGGTAQLAFKKWTPFCKILIVKNHYFIVVHTCNIVLRLFYSFKVCWINII